MCGGLYCVFMMYGLGCGCGGGGAGWARGGMNVQKAAMLFGTFTEEPQSSKLPGGVRANVRCPTLHSTA